MNFVPEYWNNVFSPFLAGMERGFTPNPDVMCNREIKFKEFLAHAMRLGADYIATGHYAHVEVTEQPAGAAAASAGGAGGATGVQLRAGLDLVKDQSYFLCCTR